MTTTQGAPWWADAGPESCEFCSVAYYLEVGYHCAGCDSPICPTCVVVVFERQVVLCPQCNAEGEV